MSTWVALALALASCGGEHHSNASSNATQTPSTTSPSTHRVTAVSTEPSTLTSLPPPSSTTPSPSPNGLFSVIVANWNWTDASRPTASYRGSAAKRGRALPTTVFIPAADGKPALRNGPFPLFVWAHGLDATVDYFDPLLRAWAARGYVVVAPTFPLTQAGLATGSDFGDYVNQSADVSFVVNQVLAAYGPSGSVHRGLVDPSRIGVGGHSLGAVTTMGLVSNRCCIDSRVKAAVEIDGSGELFPGGGTIERGVPLLLIHGDADRTFSVSESRATFLASLSPKYLIVLRGMPHTPFKIPAAYAVIVNSVGDFLDAYLKDQRAAVRRMEIDAQRPGFTEFSSAR